MVEIVIFFIIKKYLSYLSIGLKIYQPNRFYQCDRNPLSQAADPGGGGGRWQCKAIVLYEDGQDTKTSLFIVQNKG